MGTFLSTLYSRCITFWSRWFHWLPHWPGSHPHHDPLHNAEEGESKDHDPTSKRRALLVGISYHDSTDEKWKPLEGTHTDVDHFRNLLIHTYGYSPEDIVVLKDDPSFPERLQPTRANMIRELKRLVFGAAPGDKFTFLYSGHSDQQPSSDIDEEDGKDEVIVTCDLGRIIDNKLKEILVDDLPVGCSLLAIFDTCHSGTMLDLPHYYCNNVYVPWISKGDRRTKTLQNKIVRGQALDFVSLPSSASRQPTSITGVMSQCQRCNTRSGSLLWINAEVTGVLSVNQREMPVEAGPHGTSVLSQPRSESPVSGMCNGCCEYDPVPRATVVSLSACADLQRAWEGPRGSLTAVLCEFLKMQPLPSYGALMSHVNLQLHTNALALHKYTLQEKKRAARGEGPGFDGELNNFQAPQLSSLSKLNMDDTLQL